MLKITTELNQGGLAGLAGWLYLAWSGPVRFGSFRFVLFLVLVWLDRVHVSYSMVVAKRLIATSFIGILNSLTEVNNYYQYKIHT